MEFALVFPLLILLTLGNIYLSISFTQKADMNGINFLQARALSVHSPMLAPSPKEIRERIQESYMEKSGHGWVKKVESSMYHTDNGSRRDVRVALEKEPMRIDLLTNAISILGGVKPESGDKITKIKTVMYLPLEYTSGGGSDRPFTSTSVDYKTFPAGGETLSNFLDKQLFSFMPDSLSNLVGKKLFNSFVDDSSDYDEHGSHSKNGIIGTDPKRNMKKVDEFYKTWGLETNTDSNLISLSSSEEPIGGKLNFLERTAQFIEVIEATGYATDIALNFVPGLGQVLKPILEALQSAGPLLVVVEKAGTGVSNQVERNNNSLFGKSISNIDLGE